MLSVASISSASGSAEYFAGDNYYTEGDLSEHSSWEGRGAEALGLSGEVETKELENILSGKNPAGADIKERGNSRPGMDLVFSMPKNASIMAYIGDDKRLLGENLVAVKATMNWAEKNLAASRHRVDGKLKEVKTGNLVYSLFAHDTSRALDPQSHIHAVIANLTQMPDGKWQSLHNDGLWKLNTTLGQIYHSYLRQAIEKLGYETEQTGKHGQFDIKGVPREVTKEFSTRREDILAKAEFLGAKLPETLDKISMASRDPKVQIDDRSGLHDDWKDRAAAMGFDASKLRDVASSRETRTDRGVIGKIGGFIAQIGELREKFGSHIDSRDPLLTQNARARLSMPIEVVRTEWAVASAVRALSEQEAAFAYHEVGKQALDYGLPGVTIERAESRINQLINDKHILVPEGKSNDVRDMVTTPKALMLEHYIIATIEEGKGAENGLMSYAQAGNKLRDVSGDRPLNDGQFAAASMILASRDRYLAIQGIAGSGKSTMLEAFSRVSESVAGSVEGTNKSVIGLASYNKMANDLGQGAGIETRTVASFINQFEKIAAHGSARQRNAASGKLKDKIFVVDESSVIGNSQMASLLFIAEKLGADKMAFVGDRLQLPAIESGKPYALMQELGVSIAQLSENLRQQTPLLREVAATAREGRMPAALELLGSDYRESHDPVGDAAKSYLSLTPQEQSNTLVITPGRETRDQANAEIQSGLKQLGALGGEGRRHSVLEQVSTKKEDLRYTDQYRPGMVLDVIKGEQAAGLARGIYEITGISKNKYVHLKDEDGHQSVFQPAALRTGSPKFAVSILEKKDIQLHEGDKIRWTGNDKQNGLFRSADATITQLDGGKVTAQWQADGAVQSVNLDPGNKMYDRFDLNYATNTHPAQGVTAENVIAVLSAQIRNLATKQLAYVALTREKAGLTVITDSKDALEKQLDKSQSEKTSAIEVLGILGDPEAIRRDIEAMIGDTLPGSKDISLDNDREEPNQPEDGLEKGAELKDQRDIPTETKPAKDDQKLDNTIQNDKENEPQKSDTEFVDALLASLPERDLGLDR